MALRAFHANPCIGGFGGESSGDILLLDTNDNARGNIGGGGNISQSGDALCQIVKELVDNAIDACGAVVAPSDDDKEDETTKSEKLHKVKVEIQPYNEDILQVYISDTGCGMGDIQSCVNAFASSKHDGDSETAGRYGIGLTLCLLHAQRLIPHKTCITSATKNAKYLTRAFYIVDTDGDSIVCDKTEKISKTTEDESGTCVSLLIPGGKMAESAWPRLSNYFSRFRLSPAIDCSLEVYAPTLTKTPIHVRVTGNEKPMNESEGQDGDQQERPWIDGFDEPDESDTDEEDKLTRKEKLKEKNIFDRKATFRAAQAFLGTPIQLDNVARSIQPIKIVRSPLSGGGGDPQGRIQQQHQPMMEPKLDVNIIVRSLDEIPDESSIEHNDNDESGSIIELVRMVNNIPLLDSAEASACGLVSGLTNNKDLWGAFGLQVQCKIPSQTTNSWTPTYELQDSDQVAPFFRIHNHKLWEQPGTTQKRQTDRTQNQLMPAKVRLSKILIVINIQAAPISLPLPTLSKGRLPLNHGPIGKALQLGLRSCLRSLQATNPQLLLTTAQLRYAEREVHHKPALASAVSRVICRMPNNAQRGRLLSTISNWGADDSSGVRVGSYYDTDIQSGGRLGEIDISKAIEKQMTSVIQAKEEEAKKKKRRPRSRTKDNKKDESDFSDLDGSDNEHKTSDDESALGVQNGEIKGDADSSGSPYSIQLQALLTIKGGTKIDEKSPEKTMDIDTDDEWW